MKLKGCRKISKDVEYSQEKKYTWLLNLWKDAEPHNQINVHVNNKEMSFYTDQLGEIGKLVLCCPKGREANSHPLWLVSTSFIRPFRSLKTQLQFSSVILLLGICPNE